ncbi:DUF397 domain-containing protein [Actinomadura rugatobispora]|uniref:DUF397 domain-containing protein n=1 Tax=Actinomadura rugatobispora TaxID=1994 RepID=A0ABW0ZUU7_9ACTN|nr:hypothetical protein GCM10010200_024330 [Actinomadura rugatobispora]
MLNSDGTVWRKSRRCEKGEACVEVTALPGGMVGVRDGAHPEGGSVLRFSGPAWRAFRASVGTTVQARR